MASIGHRRGRRALLALATIAVAVALAGLMLAISSTHLLTIVSSSWNIACWLEIAFC